MAFKLGSEKRQIRNSKDTPIFRKNLDDGVLGEAKMDGSVEIDNSVPKGSKLEKTIIAHEKVHAKEIKSGRIAYGKDWVRSDGKTYPRKDGKIKYNGEWKPEGDKSFPWEKRAEKAEKLATRKSESNKLPDGRPGSSAYQKRKHV
tara:strand:+ start:44 stop:478 length:435 start_codon:yes stop_codon:yes gene_type:complete